MSNSSNSNSNFLSDGGATAVITHRVQIDKHPEYENWLQQIVPVCQASAGYLDWHIVRPISGVSETYTVIIRFDTETHLREWMGSSARAELIEKVRPSVAGDEFFISSGLDFWFSPAGAKAKPPIRWKQYLVTWSAIYPLVLFTPLVVLPVLRVTGLPPNRYVDMLFVTGTVVALMVYIVMPRYTNLIKRWLFN